MLGILAEVRLSTRGRYRRVRSNAHGVDEGADGDIALVLDEGTLVCGVCAEKDLGEGGIMAGGKLLGGGLCGRQGRAGDEE